MIGLQIVGCIMTSDQTLSGAIWKVKWLIKCVCCRISERNVKTMKLKNVLKLFYTFVLCEICSRDIAEFL